MLTRFKFSLSWLWGALRILLRPIIRHPGQTVLWVLFAITPFLCFFEVEILSENNPFTKLAAWQWLMNLVWYYCLLFVGFLITGRRKGAIAFDLILSFFAGLVNHYILEFRGRALFPIDILSLGTALNVADNYDYTPDKHVFGALAILLVVLALLIFLPRQKKRFGGKPWIKCVNLGLSLGWAVYIFCFFFTSMLPYFGVYAQQWKTQGNGFLLNFTVSMRYMRVEEPEGYSEEKVLEIIDSLEGSDSAADGANAVTNFIIIMNESFGDLTRFENLTLTGDPTPYFHSLTENTIKGDMYSPVTGGGTAAVEFEVLTGNNMAFLPSGTVAYQMYLTERTASLAQTAETLYARSSAYHPYLASGWNRTTAYKRLGFDSQYYLDLTVDGDDISTEYADDELIRKYVSDSADFDRIYQLTDAARENGQNCFIFNVTMQNHSGYNDEWTNLFRGTLLSGDFRGQGYDNSTHQYLALATETDKAIRELIEHYQQVEEPTVILFFGDHQPPLNNKLYKAIYGKELDERTTEEVMTQYTTPFFLWANFDIEEAEDVTVGSTFLGMMASRLAGYPQTGYMKFLDKVYEEFIAITPVAYVLADGRMCVSKYQLSDYQRQLLEQYEYLQYYSLFGDEEGNDFFFVTE